jgi:hypothetical protein
MSRAVRELHSEDETPTQQHQQSFQIDHVKGHKYRSDLAEGECLQFIDVINYNKKDTSPCRPLRNQSRCLMCGVVGAAIPSQNKNVCKLCDSVPWVVRSLSIVVKFCKGESFKI